MQQHRSLGPNSIFPENLPDDGTFVPKHVAVGTWYEVFCDLFYCVLIGFLNTEYKKIYGVNNSSKLVTLPN